MSDAAQIRSGLQFSRLLQLLQPGVPTQALGYKTPFQLSDDTRTHGGEPHPIQSGKGMTFLP